MSNIVVLYSFLFSLILDFIPAIVDISVNKATGLTLSHYIGPYSRLGSFTGTFISTIIYFNMLRKPTSTVPTNNVFTVARSKT
ncbi:hypothetical protein L596_000256 [Steinernema carpocapsae]|uniref:Uncharacterized protein n=1 Tax=Steinernema carpocapsae TaxID=34508 RepID=A0A4U8UIQ2_STECR|nr:hypothetical protein L596_000256 [Steinernema carpocapsae]